MGEAAGSAGDGPSLFTALITENHRERIISVGRDLIQYAVGHISAGDAHTGKERAGLISVGVLFFSHCVDLSCRAQRKSGYSYFLNTLSEKLIHLRVTAVVFKCWLTTLPYVDAGDT